MAADLPDAEGHIFGVVGRPHPILTAGRSTRVRAARTMEECNGGWGPGSFQPLPSLSAANQKEISSLGGDRHPGQQGN